MRPDCHRALLLAALLLASGTLFASLPADAWGNGDPDSTEFPDFGIHDITCDIALRTATYTSPELLTWITDWYIRNETDWGYSFDRANDLKGPTNTDNINAYTDDPDSYWKDWDNHTLYLHPRSGWSPPEGDAARRVSTLYNQTRDRIYRWLMNGSVRYFFEEHYAAYYAGLMSHYLMDITQFGHTDWTMLDHSHPPLYDPEDATYHSYYEARAWTDDALRHLHVDLMGNPLPEFERVSDPAQAVQDLATFVNGRHGPDVQFLDADGTEVTLGSTYVLMLDRFVSNWDAGVSWNGARGYDEELWNLTLENLVAGMNNLTNIWTSAYLDAHDMFMRDAADLVVEDGALSPPGDIYEGDGVHVHFNVTNRGNATTPGFQVLGTLDGEEEVGKTAFSLGNDSSEHVSFYFNPSEGDHALTIFADATQGTPESNESNNIWTIDFTVLGAHYAANLSADPPVLELLQDDTGRFNLTLSNLGNRYEIFDLTIEAYPGTIDFSLTLGDDKRAVEGRRETYFHIDVATFLDNPVGPRTFRLVATGENVTASIDLTVIIKERQLPPFIEVDYGFFTNVSVPMTFDASDSWDHNGDDLVFTWDFGDGNTGSGAVVQHAWETEGVYVIHLNVSDGRLHRYHTLEVSVEDAIPRDLTLEVADVDFNAARFQWTAWNSTRYFEKYRLYLYNLPDPQTIVQPANLVLSVSLPYVDSAVLRVPPGAVRYAVMEIVNIYGDAYRTNVAELVLELRTRVYGEDDVLKETGVYATSDLVSAIHLGWREWQPLLEDVDTKYCPSLITTTYVDAGGDPRTDNGIVEVPGDGVGSNHFTFELLGPGDYEVWVDYRSGDDSIRAGPIHMDLDPTNWSLRMMVLPDSLAGVAGEPVVLSLEMLFVGSAGGVSVEWGDGSSHELKVYGFEDVSILFTLEHVYEEEGNYSITVTDQRALTVLWTESGWRYDETIHPQQQVITSAGTLATVSPAEEEPTEGDPWDYLIAVGVILLIATLGVLVGHLTGYYRIGREHEGGKPSPEEEREHEAEPTAEEIISDLEEDLGGGEADGEADGEYFDHEPSVAELEDMIPREGE